jgi:tRNA modification GTPase
MFSVHDTIVAIATPPGRGGIGVVRLSGPNAQAMARCLITHDDPLQPRRATLTKVRVKVNATYDEQVASGFSRTEDAVASGVGRSGDSVASGVGRTGDPAVSGFSRTIADAIDHAVAIYFPAPHSYTGDDVVELSAHGSPVVLQAIVASAISAGARPAEPGEFTLRAFLNGRIDLTQAEAVADLIDAATPLQARAAFDQLDGTLTRAIADIDATLFDLVARLEASVDFPDEGYHFVEPGALAHAIDALIDRTRALLADARRGRLVREGLQVAIVGAPNAGKSSLFNALVGSARAIVTDVPGTTRDLVTEVVDVDGLRVTLVDTAGLRETTDPVEVEGVARSRQAIAVADLVLAVEDRSQPRVNDERGASASGAGEGGPGSRAGGGGGDMRGADNRGSDNRGSDNDRADRGGADNRGATLSGVQAAGCKVEQHDKVLCVANKADLPPAWHDDRAVAVSAVTGQGLDDLRRHIVAALDVDLQRDRPAITNVRHIALVERAHEALVRARAAAFAANGSMPEEFVLADLSDARTALEEISGRRATEDLLAHIFSRFCIGT